MTRRLLLYKTGETDPSLVADIGDYERWFERVVGGEARLEIHRAFERPRHRISGYDGMVITGSPRSLVEPEPWMDEAADFVRLAASAGVAVLGVCFGHQLIGHAFGGRVRVNPNGWEVGTISVGLTSDGRSDPLFQGLPDELQVNQSHRDEVATLGPEMRRLAGGGHTENQAIAVAGHVRGVQFHPEMDGAVIRRIITHRRELLDADAASRGRPNAIAERLSVSGDTPDAERVLYNFVTNIVRAA